MIQDEFEKFRNEIFEDGYKRGQEREEKLTGWIKPTEAEASYPAAIRIRLEKQRQLLRDMLIEGNNLLPWREPTTDLDELKKELTIYAEKRHSKSPGDGFAEYAFDIVRRIRLYRDEEALIEIEKEQNPTVAPANEDLAGTPALSQDGPNEASRHFFMEILKERYPETYKAVKSALEKGCVSFNGKKFDFHLPVGAVARLFYHTGCAEVKEIARYILIGGKEPNANSLKNPRGFREGAWSEVKKLLKL